jgi:hypothetical protein
MSIGARASLPLTLGIAALASACLGTTEPGSNTCTSSRTLQLGATVGGTISSTDCVVNGNNRTDVFRLTLNQETDIVISMSSVDFDAVLAVFTANAAFETQALVEQDDDSGFESDAQIARVLPAGRYVILAQSGDVLGEYTLSATTAGGGVGIRGLGD